MAKTILTKYLGLLVIFGFLFIPKVNGQDMDLILRELSIVDSIYSLDDYDKLVKDLSFDSSENNEISNLLNYPGSLFKDGVATDIQRKADSLYSEGSYELAAQLYDIHIDLTYVLLYSVYQGLRPLKTYIFGYNKLLDAARITFDRYFINIATSYHKKGRCFELLGRESDSIEAYIAGLNTLSIYSTRDREVYVYNQLRTALYNLIGTDWFNEFNQN